MTVWALAGFADVMRCELAETPAVAVRFVE